MKVTVTDAADLKSLAAIRSLALKGAEFRAACAKRFDMWISDPMPQLFNAAFSSYSFLTGFLASRSGK